jgi:PAS domain S-box-containing protein
MVKKAAKNMKKTFFESLQTPLLTVDPSLKILDANDAFLDLLRIQSLKEIKNHSVYELLAPDDAEILNNEISLASRNILPLKREHIYTLHFPRMEKQAFQIEIHPVKKKPLFVLLFRDGSACRKCEKINQSFNDAFLTYLTLMDEFPVMIWKTGLSHEYDYLNQAWLLFTGHESGENEKGWSRLIHPQDKNTALKIYQDAYKNRIPFLLEYRMLRHDGTYRWVLNMGRPYFGYQNEFQGFLGVCYDITERKETEETLRTLNRALKDSNNELQNFAYLASHDLKEPLRMIVQFLGLIEKRLSSQGQLDSTLQEFIHYAVDGGKRLQGLISDLLTYSRLNTDASRVEMVDLNEVVKTVLSNLRVKIEETEAQIKINSLPVLPADKNAMIRLFQNLLQNAIKYQAPNRKPMVEVNSIQKNTHWSFTVQDNGIGIPANAFNRIFQMFQRLHSPDEYEGTGMGLAICKKIIDIHNGNIWVESIPGTGSVFYFTLPAQS